MFKKLKCRLNGHDYRKRYIIPERGEPQELGEYCSMCGKKKEDR